MDMKDLYKDLPQEPYEKVMRKAKVLIGLNVESIRMDGYGGMLNMISSSEDMAEENHLIEHLTQKLSIKPSSVLHIDIEKVVNAIELGIGRNNLEIPEKTMEQQSLAENVFQYVYRTFGKKEEGWRIGFSNSLDSLIASLRHREPKKGDPFEEFLATLDLDLEKVQSPRLLVLHYPQLDAEKPIQKLTDADPENLTPSQAESVDKFLHIFSLISQVYPGKFQKDNPQGNVVVNVLDNSYRLYAARNRKYIEIYQAMAMGRAIETPTSHENFSSI